jgi:hypothetical protein
VLTGAESGLSLRVRRKILTHKSTDNLDCYSSILNELDI